ncbi:hypothetical protein ACGF0D_10660 [Kitasatospora sp. NPDC048298]|uniref:hypothetical protein n=1 Tax=Kitasatospora sp. NPDC048298 TaxID=3364049 RepID=UPI0037120620
MDEKLIPTARAVPGHRLRIVATILYPVTGLITGTPILIRKLTAPQRERWAEAAELRERQAKLDAQASADAEAAFAKKLAEAEPAKRPGMIQAREASAVAARQVEMELAKAARKASWSKIGDVAGAGILLLAVGGPIAYYVVGPLIPYAAGLGIGTWWIAALIHAPKATKQKAADDRDQAPASDDQEQPTKASELIEEEPAEEAVEKAPSATVPTPADARHAVALLGAAGTHVALTAVTTHLAAAHPSWERSGKATKGLLQGAGIRYRAGVKVDGISVPGIHRDDVPPLPSSTTTPPGAGVVAGQSNNNNHNNAQQWSTREGFVMRADPDNPARTIVVSPVPAA